MSSPADAVRLPEQFGRYTIVKKLGQGGMGAVCLARDTKLNRHVALKVCTQVENSRALARFRKEAEAAAALRHPNICPVFDYDVHNDTAYITMAYIEGQPLHRWLEEHPLDVRAAALLVRTLALAMQEAHEQGVIHRDLKPSNVAIDKRGEPIVLDFGLARLSETRTQSSSNAIVGTPAYMAPEQALRQSDAIGPATDVYALGVVLYELLTGEPPFIGPPQVVLMQLLAATPKPARQVNSSVPGALDEVCLKAMAKKPEDRYTSMRDFAAALEQVAAALPVRESVQPTPRLSTVPQVTDPDVSSRPTIPPPAPRVPTLSTARSSRPRESSRLLLGVMVVLLMLGLLAAAWIGVSVRSGSKDDDSGNAKDQSVTPVDPDHLSIPIKGGATLSMDFCRIPKGKFTMGSSKAEQEAAAKQYNLPARYFEDEPEHEVEITADYWLGKTEVTRGQFAAFVRDTGYETETEKKVGKGGYGVEDGKWRYDLKFNWKNTGFNQQDDHPVVNVSWNDAKVFCDWLENPHGYPPARGPLVDDAGPYHFHTCTGSSAGVVRPPWHQRLQAAKPQSDD